MKPITRLAAIAAIAAAAGVLTVGPAAADPVTTEGHTSPAANSTFDPVGQDTGTEGTAIVDDLPANLRVEIKEGDGTIISLATVPSLKLTLENVDPHAEEGVSPAEP